MLDEKISTIECPQPVILYNREVVYICIERSIVAQVTPVQAVPTFFALFFVFNLQYTRSCRNMFRLLEKVFFNVSPPQEQNLQKLAYFLTKLYPFH